MLAEEEIRPFATLGEVGSSVEFLPQFATNGRIPWPHCWEVLGKEAGPAGPWSRSKPWVAWAVAELFSASSLALPFLFSFFVGTSWPLRPGSPPTTPPILLSKPQPPRHYDLLLYLP